MIRAWRLGKTYGGVPALADVDLTIDGGETVRLAGAQGSGRTTLLRILATIVRPSSGGVTIGGVDVVRQPDAARRLIGYAGAPLSHCDELRVDEYLTFVVSARAMAAPRRRGAVAGAIERLQLDAAADVRRLCAGARQRLAIAAALVHEPAVALLDEPFEHLDAAARQACEGWLDELGGKGLTMVIASNDGGAASNDGGGRTVVLERGRVVGDERQAS